MTPRHSSITSELYALAYLNSAAYISAFSVCSDTCGNAALSLSKSRLWGDLPPRASTCRLIDCCMLTMESVMGDILESTMQFSFAYTFEDAFVAHLL